MVVRSDGYLGEVACWASLLLPLLTGTALAQSDGQVATRLPAGVSAVWDLEHAYRDATETRERVCINGLWRWRPASTDEATVPRTGWGHFKVPGCWPGITDYMQKDSQAVFAHSAWVNQRLREVKAAWYQREIHVPKQWQGRRIVLHAEYVNSFTRVYVNGQPVGEIRFPSGEVDLTGACQPGGTYVLSMHVVAMPLQAVMLSYNDTASAKQVEGRVARRGLCGDVFLESMPQGPRVEDVRVTPSVRTWTLQCDAACRGLSQSDRYTLQATVRAGNQVVLTFSSEPFSSAELNGNRKPFSRAWKADRLWDVDSPGNTYSLQVALCDESGRALDTSYAIQFGFREFWIDGRDFFLNGKRIFLCSVPLDNAQVGAAWATYEGAFESMRRLQQIGINFVYTHNYGCQPGSHLGFAEILRAADDAGMLIAFSQPHFSHYEWDAPDADRKNGYMQHAAFYVQAAQNHPSVVAYATSHNATGYAEDMNPDMIDGIQSRRSQWAVRNVQRAQRAERIIRSLDSSRVIYHHASGNLGPMHTSNFYANFAPPQEMSDWFEHWATNGVKPVFTCEYSVPLSWDWTLYRGWYQGDREFGSARVPWEFTLAEWNAQFLGDAAYRISERERANLRWEAKQFRDGRVWHRWDYPTVVGASEFVERHQIFARYFDDNWPAFRTWGVSAIAPWNHGHYWILRDGVYRSRQELEVDWQKLQRPGFSPDFIDERYERIDLAFEMSDWIPTVAGHTLLRNNQRLLAYIAGKSSAFTSKDHNYIPGETIEKQLIVINNSRRSVTATCRWTFDLPVAVVGDYVVDVEAGNQVRVPLRFPLPEELAPGTYTLRASIQYSTGQLQEDDFDVHVLPMPDAIGEQEERVAVYDPRGTTRKLLDQLKMRCDVIDADTGLDEYDVLIVGKQALTVSGPAPRIDAVPQGLKVVLFEQSTEVLEQRFGFRVATYGLRQVFSRLPDHPMLAGLDHSHLRDWRGAATVVPPRLKYRLSPEFNFTPTVRWCGLEVPRLWRCGNRGNVATVLIEKPHCGDFLPVLDGGYSMQYSPLLEYREGQGMILFCQMDVTDRADDAHDPAALRMVRNVLDGVIHWQPPVRRRVVFAGDEDGRKHLQLIGIVPHEYDLAQLRDDALLVVGSGGVKRLVKDSAAVHRWLTAGGHMLAIGLKEGELVEANQFLPDKVEVTNQEHIAAWFPAPSSTELLAGIGPADVHNPAASRLPLLSAPKPLGNGVLATGANNVVFCQLAPWQLEQWDKQHNLKRTFRRRSFLVSRLLANMGAHGETPTVERFMTPVGESRQASLLKNGNFRGSDNEDELPSDWIFSGSRQASLRRERLEREAGEWYACLRVLAAEGKKGNAMLAQHDVPVMKGQWYQISLRARADELASRSVSITITNMANWRSFFDYQRFEPDDNWKTFRFDVQANGTAESNTRFQIWFDGPGRVDVADVSVEPIADPTRGRWLEGLYLDQPEAWDDPYRFFRW